MTHYLQYKYKFDNLIHFHTFGPLFPNANLNLGNREPVLFHILIKPK